MSMEILIKGIFAAILGGCVTWVVFSREQDELGYTNRQRYLPYINGSLLPIYFLLVLPVFAVFYCTNLISADSFLYLAFSSYFENSLYISLFYLLFLPLLPLFRRRISARACAMLWMIPNYLYCVQAGFMRTSKPLLVIPIPGISARHLLSFWFAGFFCVLTAKTASHLLFRRRILRDAQPVTDPEILTVWEAEIERARFKKPAFQLVASPAVSSPLTIGLLQRKVRVVLPIRVFSPEDLTLIFRHEIIHIGRADALSKFFLVFCTAVCWFNPFMWFAMRKSAEDLELSCDETVLISSDEDVKRRYAELILRTAGDDRGYSTCLSASASALRYRLKNIMNPPKKNSGAFLLGFLVFALLMSCGYVSLSYDSGTGAQLIYGGRDISSFELQSVQLFEKTEDPFDNYQSEWPLYHGTAEPGTDVDTNAILSYLASLELTHLTGNYSFSDNRRQCLLFFGPSPDIFSVTLYDRYMILLAHRDGKLRKISYYLPQGTDWDYLDTLITVPVT